MHLLALFIVQNFQKIIRADSELWGCIIFRSWDKLEPKVTSGPSLNLKPLSENKCNKYNRQTDTSDNIGLNLRKMKQWVRAFRVSFFPIHKVHPRSRNNVAHNPKHTNSTQNKTMGQDRNQNHSLNSRYMKASIYTTTATTAKMHMFFLKYTSVGLHGKLGVIISRTKKSWLTSLARAKLVGCEKSLTKLSPMLTQTSLTVVWLLFVQEGILFFSKKTVKNKLFFSSKL